MKSPDHRAEALSAGASPSNKLEEEFAALLNGDVVSESLYYAKEIYEDSYKSEVIEAFLLAGADEHLINKILRVPIDVVLIYKSLFFDRAAFRDELDVESYAQSYPETTTELKWGKDLKICAITLGTDYLMYRFDRDGSHEVDMTGALKVMISNAYVLAKATKLNPLNSNAGQVSLKWMQTAIKGLEAYTRVAPAISNTDNEFEITLRTIEHTTNEKISQILKDDIVH